jgi:hypothetical protein
MESKQGTVWGIVITAVILVIAILGVSLYGLSIPKEETPEYVTVIIKPVVFKGSTVADDNETMPELYVVANNPPLFGEDKNYTINKNKLERAISQNKTVTLTIVQDWVNYIYDVKINEY